MSLSTEGGFIIKALSSSLPMYCLIQATAVFFHVSGFKLDISDFLMSTFITRVNRQTWSIKQS